jgi:diguanylate cyclase (GGDEF)-like protein
MSNHESIAVRLDPAVDGMPFGTIHVARPDEMPPAEAFDDLTWLASQLCDAPIALATLDDAGQPWFTARRGLDAGQTLHAFAFYAHAAGQDGFFEVTDALADPRFAANPLVAGAPYLRSCAAVPLLGPEGHRFGTLCVADTRPRRLDTAQREGLQRLARRAGDALEVRRQGLAARLRLARMHEERALTDALTGLPNRAAWTAELDRAVGHARRTGTAAAVAFIDIDGFRQINDACGHATGDAVLVEFTARLRRTLRRSDFVARLAGDEFVVLLDRVTDAAGNPPLVASRLMAAMEVPVEANGHLLQIRPNIGVAVQIGPDFDAATLTREADAAMYAIKRARPGVPLMQH